MYQVIESSIFESGSGFQCSSVIDAREINMEDLSDIGIDWYYEGMSDEEKTTRARRSDSIDERISIFVYNNESDYLLNETPTFEYSVWTGEELKRRGY